MKRLGFALLTLSTVLASANPSFAQDNGTSSGVRAGATSMAAGAASIPAPAGARSTATRMSSLVSGWNYFTCSYVWTYPYGSGLKVEIHNTDDSYVAAYSPTNTPNTYQQSLYRACRQQGAYYGVYIIDTSSGSWTASVGY